MKILITGGAGYIGSHVAKQLLETTSYDVVILDNLSTGSFATIDTLRNIRDLEFVKTDLSDIKALNKLFQNNVFDVIMHFAASIIVPESVQEPIKYYLNNTVNTTNLINFAIKYKVNKFIFSSTAAVYGDCKQSKTEGINEDFQTNPINPYGMSKLMSEKIIHDAACANRLFKFIIFRYFNVAGADINFEKALLSPRIGQSFPNSTHLIKIASECANLKRDELSIFGNDFDTIDGSGVRDYIHVDDLADAHIRAIQYLDLNPSDIFNVGYGRGYSVKEVVNVMKKVTGVDFKVNISKRRDGDSAILIANNNKIKEKMFWVPKYDNLELICESAFKWEKIKNN